MSNEKFEKLNKIASDVLVLSRNTLLVNLRFIDMALSRLKLVPNDQITLVTDGEYLAYNPKFIIDRYRQEKEVPVRDYLHIVMHCVYRHMFVHSLINQELWNLACDIAVENAINELNLRSVETSRVSSQQVYTEQLKNNVKFITAEKVYRYLMDNSPDEAEKSRLSALFESDDHAIWYVPPEYRVSLSSDNSSGETGDTDGNNQSNGQTDSQSGGQSAGQPVDAATSMMNAIQNQLEEDWKNVSERMQQDLETFSKSQGYSSGSMMQNLEAVNREKYNYEAFLKKFAVMGEVMKINDDEFDYIFYTYGLKKYKKMPLIEPLEYKEVKRIKEFVIAIDTSGSVSGAIVQKFVQKTFNIMKSTESFHSKINVHIIQCDAEIQEHVIITNQDEFDNYLKHMTIKGLGGTDFRPVFSAVDDMITRHEFINLKGLIYFTDGWGTFPARKPDYETAFVFLDDDFNNPEVPPWAIKLVLQSEEI